MAQFMTRTTANAAPEQVLQVLTDPESIRDWSPIPFELDDLDGIRLETGSLARVSGSLAGKRVGFDVEVHSATTSSLELTAEGPIAIDVLYEFESVDGGGSEVTASVGVRGGSGLTGRLLASATGALLKAGALDAAASRIARAAELAPCAVLA
jgi:hypothetical protein